MKEKVTVQERVEAISKDFHIEKNKTNEIIAVYLDYCKKLLYSGYNVEFLNLVRLEPDIVVGDVNYTLGYQCKQVSKLCGVGYYTVFAIVKSYLEHIKEEVLEGKIAEIRGIVTIKPVVTGGVVTGIHSFSSLSHAKNLEQFRKEYITDVTSVRVHTLKNLKYVLKGRGGNV